MSERELQRAVGELAQFLGFKVAHFRTANTGKGYRTPVAFDGKGYPDLTLVGQGRIVFLELKSEKGHLSPSQEEWRKTIITSGGEWYLITPVDWTSGKVEQILGSSPLHA